jgi:hypothetical protein
MLNNSLRFVTGGGDDQGHGDRGMGMGIGDRIDNEIGHTLTVGDVGRGFRGQGHTYSWGLQLKPFLGVPHEVDTIRGAQGGSDPEVCVPSQLVHRTPD